MTLDIHYIPMSLWQEYFVDNRTGLPLAGGVVEFYKDSSRITHKNVYKIDGTAPAYTYTALPNPLVLSDRGTIVDEFDNDIIPYFYPYDTNGKVELYYYIVYSWDSVLQFTRQGVPNVADTTDAETSVINYLANGQFLLHNNIPATSSVVEGTVTDSITHLDEGSATFERLGGTTAVDIITFPYFGGSISIPTSNPKYACRIERQNPGTGGFASVRFIFYDVNKFASNTQDYTFSFAVRTNIGLGLTISANLIKYYGSGGSATDTIPLQTFNITDSYADYNIHFKFGTNAGKTITENSYLQLEISLPVYSFDISLTNVALLPGIIELNNYPVITEKQMRYQLLAAPIPDYNGNDAYLPMIITREGIKFDRSHIGRIYTHSGSQDTSDKPMLVCGGASYDSAQISNLGIPYKRLSDYYRNDSILGCHLPLYGTGSDRCTATCPGADSLSLTINIRGSVAPNAVDGAPATGFIFADNPTRFTGYKTTDITFSAASAIAPGANFIFYDNNSRMYIVWYTKDGVGAKPIAAAHRYILVDIASSASIEEVRAITLYNINDAYFAVPDYAGKFLRSHSGSPGRDPDAASRRSGTNYDDTAGFGVMGANVGSNQADEFRAHNHPAYYKSWFTPGSHAYPGGGTAEPQHQFDYLTGMTGGNETRPTNQYVLYYVGY